MAPPPPRLRAHPLNPYAPRPTSSSAYAPLSAWEAWESRALGISRRSRSLVEFEDPEEEPQPYLQAGEEQHRPWEVREARADLVPPQSLPHHALPHHHRQQQERHQNQQVQQQQQQQHQKQQNHPPQQQPKEGAVKGPKGAHDPSTRKGAPSQQQRPRHQPSQGALREDEPYHGTTKEYGLYGMEGLEGVAASAEALGEWTDSSGEGWGRGEEREVSSRGKEERGGEGVNGGEGVGLGGRRGDKGERGAIVREVGKLSRPNALPRAAPLRGAHPPAAAAERPRLSMFPRHASVGSGTTAGTATAGAATAGITAAGATTAGTQSLRCPSPVPKSAPLRRAPSLASGSDRPLRLSMFSRHPSVGRSRRHQPGTQGNRAATATATATDRPQTAVAASVGSHSTLSGGDRPHSTVGPRPWAVGGLRPNGSASLRATGRTYSCSATTDPRTSTSSHAAGSTAGVVERVKSRVPTTTCVGAAVRPFRGGSFPGPRSLTCPAPTPVPEPAHANTQGAHSSGNSSSSSSAPHRNAATPGRNATPPRSRAAARLLGGKLRRAQSVEATFLASADSLGHRRPAQGGPERGRDRECGEGGEGRARGRGGGEAWGEREKGAGERGKREKRRAESAQRSSVRKDSQGPGDQKAEHRRPAAAKAKSPRGRNEPLITFSLAEPSHRVPESPNSSLAPTPSARSNPEPSPRFSPYSNPEPSPRFGAQPLMASVARLAGRRLEPQTSLPALQDKYRILRSTTSIDTGAPKHSHTPGGPRAGLRSSGAPLPGLPPHLGKGEGLPAPAGGEGRMAGPGCTGHRPRCSGGLGPLSELVGTPEGRCGEPSRCGAPHLTCTGASRCVGPPRGARPQLQGEAPPLGAREGESPGSLSPGVCIGAPNADPGCYGRFLLSAEGQGLLKAFSGEKGGGGGEEMGGGGGGCVRSFHGSESSHSVSGPWTQDSSTSDSEEDRITLSNKPHLKELPPAMPAVDPRATSAASSPASSAEGEVDMGLEPLSLTPWDVPPPPGRRGRGYVRHTPPHSHAQPPQPKAGRSSSGKLRPRLELVIPEADDASMGMWDEDDVSEQEEPQQRGQRQKLPQAKQQHKLKQRQQQQQQQQQQKAKGGGLLRTLSEALVSSLDSCPYSVTSKVSASAPSLARPRTPAPATSPVAPLTAFGHLASAVPATVGVAAGADGTSGVQSSAPGVHRRAPSVSSLPSLCPSVPAKQAVPTAAAGGTQAAHRGLPGMPGVHPASPRDSWTRQLLASFRVQGAGMDFQRGMGGPGRGFSRGQSRGSDRGSGKGKGGKNSAKPEKLPEFGHWRESRAGGQQGYTRQFERLRAEKMDPAAEDIKAF